MFTREEIDRLQGKHHFSYKSVLVKKAVTTVVLVLAVNAAANLVEKKIDAHAA